MQLQWQTPQAWGLGALQAAAVQVTPQPTAQASAAWPRAVPPPLSQVPLMLMAHPIPSQAASPGLWALAGGPAQGTSLQVCVRPAHALHPLRC